jgi:hypothetical protein
MSAIIEFQPPHPRPGELVEATLKNLPSNVGGSPITWRINGEVVDAPIGDRGITFIADGTDRPTTVTASVGGSTIRQTIQSSYLDVIIEPQTRVPGFYQGRAVPSSGSRINATALVNGTSRNPSELVYFWRLNFDVIGGGPGRGRSSVAVDLPRFESNNILTVEVSLPTGEVIARRSFTIPTVTPQVRFYEFDPLLGLAMNPLIDNTLVLSGNSATIHAEPFYLDTRVFNEPDILEWRIAGVTTPNTNRNPYEITVQRQFNAGPTNIAFRMSDTQNFSQAARGNFTIQ